MKERKKEQKEERKREREIRENNYKTIERKKTNN
jgi:hypothetical protein